METIISRRQLLWTGLAAAAILSPFGRLAIAGETPKRKYIQIGNLQFEEVDPSETPTPSEYVDPSNTGTPLIKVPKNLLNENITKNFKLGEFARVSDPRNLRGTGIETHSFNGGLYHKFMRLDPELPDEVQTLRDALGHPITVNSCFRPLTYNRRVGSQDTSMHPPGKATDIASKGFQAALYRLADKQFANGGVGKYTTFTHVDTRGSRARWNG
ncbi:MAG: D-Ala-D-Ala carboxypeptidase family metallohydrolase [archaeon]